MNSFSVIIPVYNGEKFITSCLESLYGQDYPPDKYEIIIVNNNSTDNSMKLVDRDRVKVLFESKKSSYAARNRGIAAAGGKILAFSDVDCIASKDWLKTANEHFLSKDDQIVSGAVELFYKKGLNIWGLYDHNRFLKQEANYYRKGAATANLFAAKEVFERVGLFDADLQSSGDVTWVNRACQKGVKFGYNDLIKVYHPVRNSHKEVAEKCYRVGFGRGQLAGKNRERFYLINPKHLSPGPKTLKNLLGKPVFRPLFIIKMLLVIYYLNGVEYKGKIKGYFAVKNSRHK